MSDVSKNPSFVLVHGAWHGGWCWDQVSHELQSHGYECSAPDLPIDDSEATFDDYAKVVADTAADFYNDTPDIVLVGHSRAANVIPRVAGIIAIKKQIFICGSFEPETLGLSDDALSQMPPKHMPNVDTLVRPIGDELAILHPEDNVKRMYYSDCPPEIAQQAVQQLRPQRRQSSVEPMPVWPQIASEHLYCPDDRVLNPEYSRHVARQYFGVDAIPLPGGHFSPLFAYPEMTAQILINLAENTS